MVDFVSQKVTYVDHMGTDLSVVNAARVSFHKESALDEKGILKEADAKLIRFLAKHNHEIPFAHTALSVRVRCCFVVARQLYKHKVGFVENEVSRRYVSDLPEVIMMPYLRAKAPDKKQGSLVTQVDSNVLMMAVLEDSMSASVMTYKALINAGVCPEQARMVLPMGAMTEFIWTGNLLSFSRMYNLRTTPDAQIETRDIANQCGVICKRLWPVAWEALTLDADET